MKLRTIFWGLFALRAVVAVSQPDSLYIPSINRFRSFSIAEGTYEHQKGAYGNPMLPQSVDRYAVRSESYQTLGNVSLYGKLGYMLTRRNEQNWNGMTNSYWSAATLCDSVSGNQRAERYDLAGAFSLPLDEHWCMGARIDYQVELTAKDTDPRNRNQWMKWQFNPGVTYESGTLRYGISLLYARRKEGVDYRHAGNHVTYPVFVAYPLGFFGTLSASEPADWQYSGQEAGGALQLDYIKPQLHISQQLGGRLIRQEVESNRVENKQQSETKGWRLTYTGRVTRLLPHSRHEWTVEADYHRAQSYEPLQRQEAGSPWQTYGQVLRSTGDEGIYRFMYGYHRLFGDSHPRFSILSGITFRQTESALLFYPTKYSQPIHRLTADVTWKRHFSWDSTQLDLAVGGLYGTGWGSMQNEKQLGGQSQPDIRLWQNTEWQQQVYRYETASRWQLSVSLMYTHKLDNSPLRWFIGFTGRYGQDAERLVRNRGSNVTAQIGILF